MKTLYTIIIFSFISSAALAQAGALDITFDADGYVLTTVGNNGGIGYAVVIQPDQKIIVAGNAKFVELAIVRYNIDGSLDNSFNGVGILTDEGNAYALALQSDGRIVVGGSTTNNSFLICRYNTDGTLDTNFNGSGKVIASIGGSIKSVAVQTDGKIVASGSNGIDLTTVRYNINGIIDSSFNGNGKVVTDMYGYDDYAESVAIQTDGKIVLGCSTDGGSNLRFGLIRYNADGTVDNSFGTNGKVKTNIGLSNSDFGRSIRIQTDGKIVFVGNTVEGSNSDFVTVRYNTDGNLDEGFAGTGIIKTDVAGNSDYAEDVVIQPNGKIIVAGSVYVNNGSGAGLALVRYNNDGSMDSSFGANGIVTTDIGNSGGVYGYSAALSTDGRIVVSGVSDNTYFLTARYLTELYLGILNFTAQEISPLIYPNPIQQNEVLQYTITKDEVLTLNLYDVNGRLIKNFFTQQKRNAGEHKEQLSIGNIAAGSYLLTLSNGENNVSVKVVRE